MFDLHITAVAIVIALLQLAFVRLRADDPIRLGARRNTIEATRENANEAAALMKDWAVWLVAIQTAVTFGLLAIYGGQHPFPPLVGAAIAFLGASILVESLLLAGLPTLVLRLRSEPSLTNDLYEAPLFVFIPVRTGAIYLLTHLSFVTGVAFIAAEFLVNGVPKWPG